MTVEAFLQTEKVATEENPGITEDITHWKTMWLSAQTESC